MNAVAKMYQTSTTQGRRLSAVDRKARPIIEFPLRSTLCPGIFVVAGYRYTGLNSDPSKPWVKVDAAAGTASEEGGPPSDPMPDNEEWFEKRYCPGEVHVARL